MTTTGESRGPGEGDGRDPRGSGTERKPRVRLDPRSFHGTPPRELLRRFLDDDPLDIELRCELRQSETCYLISPERLFFKAVARCAFAGFAYRGEPPVDEWIARRIDESIEDILEEDEEGAVQNLPIEEGFHYDALSEAVGFRPKVARRAHVAFNALPRVARAAWFAVVVHGRTAEEYAATERSTPDLVKSSVVQAVMTLLQFSRDAETGGIG
jgi:hypothetical protein